MAKALVVRLDTRWRSWWLEFCWLDRRGDCVVPLRRLYVSPLADVGAFKGKWGVFNVLVERYGDRWEVTGVYDWSNEDASDKREGSASGSGWTVIRS